MTNWLRPLMLSAAIAGSGLGWDCVALAQTTQPAADAPPASTTAPTFISPTAPAMPAVDLSRDKVLYVVGYAHLDTQWRWTYPQVIREYIPATMRKNFLLFEKYPNYVFNFSGSRRYEMMREYYPDDYAKVKQYVAAGRWFPCGSSVDENDANVPSAESFVRHVLYGNRFFRHEFGTASEEYMLPDCFGFPYALPTMLSHCGIKGFSTQKLTWGSAVGIPFKVGLWEGPDGKSVLAAFDPGAYVGEVKENLANSPGWTTRVENNGKSSGVYTDYHYYGTGDRGGAPSDMSAKWVNDSVNTRDGAMRVISGPADWMFKSIAPDQQKNLPRYKGELLLTQHSAGSITSQAFMKRMNRKNELLADLAERASVGAMLMGNAPYPSQQLYNAWDLILGSQMHDILPGTSLPKAYEYSWNDELLAANQLDAVACQAVATLAANLDTRAQGVPLVVYNPLSIDRTDLVEAAVNFAGEAPTSVAVIGPDGTQTSGQVIAHHGRQATILFRASVPSVGCAVYDVRPAPASAGDLKVDEKSLENQRYRVTINADGDVASIIDKENANRELLSGPARIVFQYENPAQYPAWNMDWEDRQKPPRAYVTGPAKVRVIESGPARVALEIERQSQGSTFIQRIRLGAGSDRVEFDTQIDWHTQQSSLRQVFPLTISNPLATYDLQVGAIERDNNKPSRYESPAHQWFDLTHSDGSYGVSVLNDCKFGSDKPDDSTLRLTLLYTPGTRAGVQDQGTQDFGRHQILYALYGHAKDWRAGGTVWQGAQVNQPLRAFAVDAHGGAGKTLSLFRVSNPQVAISAIKKAEDGDGVIVRLRETSGTPAENVGISSVRKIESAREVDGQERPVGPATLENGALVTSVPAYALRAFEIHFAKSSSASLAQSTPVTLPYDTDVISPDTARSDGAMDSAGRSYPAEQLGKIVTHTDAVFTIGSSEANQKNAVTAHGQSIELPEGDYDRVAILAASSDGDVDAPFMIGDARHTLHIQHWTGYIGQFDNRVWGGQVPEMTYDWHNPLIGLDPGYVKPATVGWFCSHLHNPQDNEFYQYSYLFSYVLPRASGARTLVLPDDPRIKVLAISVVKGGQQALTPASPLSDTLADHALDAPIIDAAAQSNDTVPVTMRSPLYFREGNLRYTTDGSDPTAQSPMFTDALYLSDTATIKARAFDAAGRGGPVAARTIHVKDTTAPTLTSDGHATFTTLRLKFSEPVDATAANDVSNYSVDSDCRIASVALDAHRTSALLTFDRAPQAGTKLTIKTLKDQSPAGNASVPIVLPIEMIQPLYRLEQFSADGQKGISVSVPNAPCKAEDAWTINCFVLTARQPANRTIIAGFGHLSDTNGQGRYLAKFANGVHHWTSQSDVDSTVPLDLNQWQMLTTTYDGRTLRLYKNGELIGQRQATLADDESTIEIAPLDAWEHRLRFKGDIREFTLWRDALSPETLKNLLEMRPK